jgi:hypothetical protein
VRCSETLNEAPWVGPERLACGGRQYSRYRRRRQQPPRLLPKRQLRLGQAWIQSCRSAGRGAGEATRSGLSRGGQQGSPCAPGLLAAGRRATRSGLSRGGQQGSACAPGLVATGRRANCSLARPRFAALNLNKARNFPNGSRKAFRQPLIVPTTEHMRWENTSPKRAARGTCPTISVG